MITRRYAIDQNNRKLFIGSAVRYKSNLFLVQEIDYLSWNTNQYLTLMAVENKNKKLHYISPNDVRVINK